jgi:hypothetical protein
VAPVSGTGDSDGAAFALNAGALSLTRDHDWRANVVVMFAGAPSAV